MIMNSTAVACLSFGCIFGATLLGLAIRRLLPEHHLSADSKDAIKVGAGMISMMAALVLGLLVSSAKQHYDATSTAIVTGGAKVIILDRVLAAYGSDCSELRRQLYAGVEGTIALLWPEERQKDTLSQFEKTAPMEGVLLKLYQLKPQTEAQRALQQQALDICNDLLLTRWLQVEQAQTTLPVAFIAILLFWLTMLYTSFGLLAPHNTTVLAAMFIGALALATALFLIMEMNRPMSGSIKISSAPLRKTLEQLGR